VDIYNLESINIDNTNLDNIYNYGTEQRVNKLKNVIKKRQKSITIVMENIADPHNFSACLRSCDAVGMLDVCLLYHSGQTLPVSNKTSSGSASKWVNTKKFHSVKKCFDTLHSEGKKIYTTHLSTKSISLYDLDLTQNIALVFGNEHSGISDEAVKLADENFLIPQIGIIQSLNISVACAVSVFEAFRQRQAKGFFNKSELSELEINAILKNWLLK
jgi:tRNA (guanosine-2'-O-)-methyltransferase